MSRSLTIALLLALATPLCAQAQAQETELAALDLAEVSATSAGLDDDAQGEDEDELSQDDQEYEEEEYDDEEVEYCGDGDPSLVDQVYEEMEWGSARSAHRTLVRALKHGEVDGWERPYATALLAELELRLGRPGRAIVNFRRAERMQAGVIQGNRVALAAALYLRGERRAAEAEAREARENLCADRYAVAGCYGANLVLSRTTRDTVERDAASEAAGALRSSNPDLASSFDELDGWIRRGNS